MTEFDTGLPSIKQLQGYVKNKQEVELKLVTDDLIVGKIMWHSEPHSLLRQLPHDFLRDGVYSSVHRWIAFGVEEFLCHQ